ncbi:unnamed protein product, partial [Symbiodinium pilosum]
KCRELMQKLMATEAARFLQAVWRGRGPRKALKALKDIERAKFEATKRRLAEAAEKIARNKERERLAARLKEISATDSWPFELRYNLLFSCQDPSSAQVSFLVSVTSDLKGTPTIEL